MRESADSSKQNDALLWLAGAVIGGIGVAWLVMSKPWSSSTAALPVTDAPVVTAVATTPMAPRPAATPGAAATLESALDDNPLRMADLAYEAGMLVEPEEYSAWALYRKVLEQDPENAEAKIGLEKIAEELLRRGHAAVEQGRFDDARATVERIRSAIPVHPGVNDLAFRIEDLSPQPVETPKPATAEAAERPEPAPTAREPEAQPARAAAPAAPAVDPIDAPRAAFEAALAENRLLTPIDSSAKHYAAELAAIDPEHEVTRESHAKLFAAFLARASAALATADTDSAATWMQEADMLDVDDAAVAAARGELRTVLIRIESARRVPASSLTVVAYTPPEYPPRALERALDGWVDLEFTVGTDGSTRDIVVTDASHRTYFREEAVDAVEEWRFEPRIFMSQPIEQRAYTRVRFNFE